MMEMQTHFLSNNRKKKKYRQGNYLRKMKGILTDKIRNCRGSCTAQDRKARQWVIKHAQIII